jgi:tellurite resistance protein TehA-like permease
MKAYLMTTGTVFGLIVLAHVWRLFEEGLHPATEVPFVMLTVVSAALGTWAWLLLARHNRA